MKKLLFSLALVLVVSAPLHAQVRWGVRAGLSEDDPMVGAEAIVPITGDLVFNPNLEYTTDLYDINADLHYDFDISSNTAFWVGAGLAFVKPEGGDYEGGVNILGGIGTRRNRMYPYAQVKLTSAQDAGDFATVALGVRF